MAMITRYDEMFRTLSAKGQMAFIPFVMLGDPSFEATLALVDLLVASGADALELGVPFSDPVADGPVIQAAALRALAAGATLGKCFPVLAEIRRRHARLPLGLLVYANLVAHRGLAHFYEHAASAGVDSVLVADVPTAEATPFSRAARLHGIAPVQIVPPNAGAALFSRVAMLGDGYSYVLGRAGVTGAESGMKAPARALIDALQEAGAPPPVIGFGISTPTHVREAKAAGAAGVISGSVLVALGEQHRDDDGARRTAIAVFVREMKSAT